MAKTFTFTLAPVTDEAVAEILEQFTALKLKVTTYEGYGACGKYIVELTDDVAAETLSALEAWADGKGYPLKSS